MSEVKRWIGWEIADVVQLFKIDSETIFVEAKDYDAVVKELETERLRLAGCGVAALMNTQESKANRITRDNPYWSASYRDVCDMVDREIELREENARLREALAALSKRHDWTFGMGECICSEHMAAREILSRDEAKQGDVTKVLGKDEA